MSKMILDCPNCFGQVQIFWSSPNGFGQVQIRTFFGLIFTIWTCPKCFGPDQNKLLIQNDWFSTKTIWTIQKHFGPIEGQNVRQQLFGLSTWIIFEVKIEIIGKKPRGKTPL